MKQALRTNAVLAYLVAVLLLGGASAAGHGVNLLLQLIGAALIAWTLLADSEPGPVRTGLRRFAIAAAVLAAVQFLPLPPGLWKLLPGREAVHDGFLLIGADAPWLTLSLAPWESISSLTWWIPAFALFVAMRSAEAPDARRVITVVVVVAILSVALGVLQRSVGAGYLYRITNYGQGPGFFANSNHQGSFLLVALALWGGHFALALARQSSKIAFKSAALALPVAVAITLILGVLVSGSLACLMLLVPTLLALTLVLRPNLRVPLPALVIGAAAIVAGLIAFLLLGPIANDLTGRGATPGISRQEYLINGLRMLGDFAPFGSGLGTFQELYRWYEDPQLVGTTYVTHAHDDLLELLIETGVFGLAALGLFLWWFARRTIKLWQTQRHHSVALAATVAIGVELTHSLVDFPLRTAAMSSMVAVCCALMLRAPQPTRAGRSHRSTESQPNRDVIRI